MEREEGVDRPLRPAAEIHLHCGRILAERSWKLGPNPADPLDRVGKMTTGRTSEGHAIEDVASVQKSVLSFLAGVARGRGLLDFDAPLWIMLLGAAVLGALTVQAVSWFVRRRNRT